MYLHGLLSIDPSQATNIEVKQPTKAFGKLCKILTLGLSNQREERETFTALSILQLLNQSFRDLGITDIVQLSLNDETLYEDTEGVKDDMKLALESLEEHHRQESNGPFETLSLVLEHEADGLRTIFEIQANRVHRVGEDPIRIEVTGFFQDKSAPVHSSEEEMREALRPHFKEQDIYDEYIKKKKNAFDLLLEQVEQSIRKRIPVDRVNREATFKMLRPNKKWSENEADGLNRRGAYGYAGADSFLLYCWLWSDLCHEEDVWVNDFDLVDESGRDVLSVGAEGFNAGETTALAVGEDFVAPTGDVSYASGRHDFSDQITTQETTLQGADFSDTVSSFDFGDTGSSCGGGCGGGCSS